MSYLMVEVEIDHGRVITKDSAKLPEKGSGVLMIRQPEVANAPVLTQLQALEALQKHLHLDASKAADWMAGVCEARRSAGGMDEKQAADLRARLTTFAEDWERPEASVYDEDRPHAP